LLKFQAVSEKLAEGPLIVNLIFDDFFSLANFITRRHNYKLKKHHS